jgi:hypothetical protein
LPSRKSIVPLCGKGAPLLTTVGELHGGGWQRALDVGPWRENALMVQMTTTALFRIPPAKAA